MIAVDELKEPDCGNATDKTEKDAEVENPDNVDDETNNMDNLRSKKKPGSCLNMMKADKQSPRVQSNLMKMLMMIKLMILRFRSLPGSWGK